MNSAFGQLRPHGIPRAFRAKLPKLADIVRLGGVPVLLLERDDFQFSSYAPAFDAVADALRQCSNPSQTPIYIERDTSPMTGCVFGKAESVDSSLSPRHSPYAYREGGGHW